jgi:hypothetical protein
MSLPASRDRSCPAFGHRTYELQVATSQTTEDAVHEMIRFLVNAWSRSPMIAVWPVDGTPYVYIGWARETLAIERALGVSADEAAQLAQRAIARMTMERDWDSEAVGWDVSNDFPDWEPMAVSIRKTLLPSARRHYAYCAVSGYRT